MLSLSSLFEELTPTQEKLVYLLVGDNPYERKGKKLYLKKTKLNPRIEITPEMFRAASEERRETNRRLRPYRGMFGIATTFGSGALGYYLPDHFTQPGSTANDILPFVGMGAGSVLGALTSFGVLFRDAKRRGVEFYRNYYKEHKK